MTSRYLDASGYIHDVNESEQTRPVGQGGADPQLMAAALAAELLKRSSMVCTAESLTGGALGDLLSAAPGASDTYLGGVVSYATRLKVSLLGVAPETVAEHGVVSAECAAQMATGARSLTGSDYAVSTTGVAGPTGQEGKPVGLVYVGVAGPGGVSTKELHLSGSRAEIRQMACLEAVSAVIEMVVGVTE
ncbi:MAG TPA: CinA family protein [Nocardioidaceae bacterium]|nr:CinA family protein [Nocardioidaceae bacterium]